MGPDGLIPTLTNFGTALADIVKCARCGHMQLEPMPDQSRLRAAYADAVSDHYLGEEAGQRATARSVLNSIERHAPGRGALLDIGCWLGLLLDEARARGWLTLGLEPSVFASGYAREQLQLDVRTTGLLDAEVPAGSQQAVTMGDVIEHLPVPGEAVIRIREMLAPRGLLWMALPDAGSRFARAMGRRWWSVLPTHVQYFTRKSVRTLLVDCGFEVLEIDTAPKAFTVGYYLNRLQGYSPAAARALMTAARYAGVADRLWAPDFRDRMAILARRVD